MKVAIQIHEEPYGNFRAEVPGLKVRTFAFTRAQAESRAQAEVLRRIAAQLDLGDLTALRSIEFEVTS